MSKPKLNYNDVSFNTPEARSRVINLQSAIVARPAVIFLFNLDNVVSLINLPIQAMSYMAYLDKGDFLKYRFFVSRGYSDAQILQNNNISSEDQKKAQEYALDNIKKLFEDNEVYKANHRTVHQSFQGLIQNSSSDVSQSAQSLLYLAVSQVWTTFETLASDLWVAIVNNFTLQIGERIVRADNSKNGLQQDAFGGKNVPIGILAKYGFDLRGVLGTIQKEKFDFTSVSGIKEAYNAALEEKDALKKLFDNNKEVQELEFVRNLIVHQAGKVDQTFINKTHSTANVGEQLSIDTQEVANYLNAVADVGCGLVELVDKWVASETNHYESKD